MEFASDQYISLFTFYQWTFYLHGTWTEARVPCGNQKRAQLHILLSCDAVVLNTGGARLVGVIYEMGRNLVLNYI